MMPTALDFWVFSRVMTDPHLSVNGELADMSDAFRPLAELLIATPFPDRGRLFFDVFLAGRTDRDAIIRAMADVKPTDPPPAAGSGPPVERLAAPASRGIAPGRALPGRCAARPGRPAGERGSGRDRLPAGLPRSADAGRRRGDDRPISQLAAQAGLLRRPDPLCGLHSARPRTGRRPP